MHLQTAIGVNQEYLDGCPLEMEVHDVWFVEIPVIDGAVCS